MKTRKLLAAALALPMLFACTKENIKPSVNPIEEEKFDFTVNVISAAEKTKAFFSDENGIYWDNVDKKGGIINESNKYESTGMSHYHYPNSEVEGVHNQASFKFTAAEGDYKFFYPYRSESTFDKILFEVETYQTTGVGASSDVFALISKDRVSLTTKNDLAADTHYQVVGSYIQFLVYGKEGEQVKSIAVKCDNNSRISGQYYVDGKDNSLTGVYYNGQDLLLDLQGKSCPTTLNKDDAQGLYAAILPSSTDFPTAQNTYVVTTDGGIYTFASASGKSFNFGSIKTLPLNLTKATSFSKTPEHLYIIGGATQAGWNADSAIELTRVPEKPNQFKVENLPLNAGSGDSGFKFLTTKGSWNKVYVNGLNNNTTITYYEDPDKAGNDTKFSVDKSGYYDVVVDFDDNTVTCTIKDTPMPQVYTYPDGNENVKKVNMSFTETKNVYKAIIYLAEGDKKHDFKINYKNQYYHVNLANGGWQEVNFGPAEDQHKVYYDWDVIADNSDQGWYVYNEYCNKYYELTFDSENKKVTLKLAQGNSFWITGYQFGTDENDHTWPKLDKYKSTVEDGKVTWDIDIPDGGGFNILGEYGEYYTSDSTDGYWNWNSYTYGWDTVYARFKNGLQPWNFTEGGKYKVTFWPSTLQIKVEKL